MYLEVKSDFVQELKQFQLLFTIAADLQTISRLNIYSVYPNSFVLLQ